MSRLVVALSIMLVCSAAMMLAPTGSNGSTATIHSSIYDPGELPPTDSVLRVVVGDIAPDFSLRGIDGSTVRLSSFLRKKNVVLSFVPAAWTPVCSDQWPGYNISRKMFDDNDAILLGISVDNIPTLHAWTQQMGPLWFPVLSDFWPHGKVADSYGVLRGDGTAERALFFIDRQGIIRAIEVSDINVRPALEHVVRNLKLLSQGR